MNALANLETFAPELREAAERFPGVRRFLCEVFGLGCPVPQAPALEHSWEERREREFLAACRECAIRPAVAMDLSEDDQATAARRRAVMTRLIQREWTDAELRGFFKYDARTFRRRRRAAGKTGVRSLSAAAS